MKKGFRFFVSLMLAVALVCGTAGSLAEGTLDTLLPDISLEDRSVLDGITLSDAGATGETNAEEPAAEVPVEGIGDLETILPSLGDSSVLDAIVLPDAGITEENPAYTAGDIVTFGRYPQTEEGTDETPIEWIVLEVDGENHRALLISKYALDAVPYNTEDTDITWETCTLRAWLNDDFMNRAFSAEEQSAILLTDVDNSDAQGYTGWASGGNNTQDRIFLLSYAEANRYFNVRLHSDNTASRAISTAYAIRRGADAGRNTPVLWWLRSPGSEQDGVASVSKYGTLCISLLNYAGGCIRPAIWISLPGAGATGETNAEESATDTGVLETLLPNLNPGESSVLDSISLPDEETAEEEQAYTAGSIVTFGRYPQTAEGTDETPIEWIVLEVDEENHRALLISKYGLDANAYSKKSDNNTWETCALRPWLNQDFLSKAFSREEQDAILLTDVDNSAAQGCGEWNTTGGNNTQDKIFLLSYAEAKQYFNVEYHTVPGSDRNMASRIVPTAYAIKRGAYTSDRYRAADGSEAGWWWLRSPGNRQECAVTVDYIGSFYNRDHYWDMGCVRPALWISTESGFFRLDGTASGSDRQADAEAFVFRNGITWGMSREEVIGREGDVYDESGMNGILELTYRSVQISQYSGDMGCIFSADDASGYALQLCIYTLRDVEQDAFDYLMTAYDSKYGEHREADLQDLVDICGRIDPNFTIGGNPQNYSFCRWDTGDGTGIWMLWGDFTNGVLNIFYVSPTFLNPTEEGPDLTGI